MPSIFEFKIIKKDDQPVWGLIAIIAHEKVCKAQTELTPVNRKL